MRVGALFALFLLVLSLSFAQCPADPNDWEGPKPCISLPTLGLDIVLMFLLLSVSIIALASMLGNALQSPIILAWSKTELRELFVGAILVALIWGFVASTDLTISTLFLSTGEENLAELGSSSLNPMILYLEMLYGKVADAYLSIGMMQGTSYFSVFAPAWWAYFSMGTSPMYGVSILMGPLSVAANNLTIQMLTLRGLQQFMAYASIAVPGFLLPIALSFRLFPFTRNLGNTLIGLCLGVLFIMPLSLMLVNDLYVMASDTSTAAGFKYKAQVESTSFKVEKMYPTRPMYDVGGLILNTVCKNYALRAFTTLGEIVWGIVYGIVNIASCGYPPFLYPICFAQKFIEFVLIKWPEIMFYAELTMASLMLPVIASDILSDGGVDSSLTAIPYVLLPAVAEATGFSILSFVVIAFITIGGTTAISSALGGEHFVYGIARFV